MSTVHRSPALIGQAFYKGVRLVGIPDPTGTLPAAVAFDDGTSRAVQVICLHDTLYTDWVFTVERAALREYPDGLSDTAKRIIESRLTTQERAGARSMTEEHHANRVYAIATTAHGIRYADNFLVFNDSVQEAQNEHGLTYAGDFNSLGYEMTDTEFCTELFDLDDDAQRERWQRIQADYTTERLT